MNQRKRQIRKEAKYRKAMWYLGRGYPHSFIAAKLGVHRNSIMKWSELLAAGDQRSIQRLWRKIERWPRHHQQELQARLKSALEAKETVAMAEQVAS